ncbi:MAG TPA: hypothetical protein DCM62_09720 [Bacteroidales bacterium]|nr:hypothetical protein [Bacteroidales bacterium]
MKKDKIKNYYVKENTLDNTEYSLKNGGFYLPNGNLRRFAKPKTIIGRNTPLLQLDLIYKRRKDVDALYIEVTMNSFGLANYYKNLLTKPQVFFTLDNNETIHTGKVVTHDEYVSPSGHYYTETVRLEADIAFLAELANARLNVVTVLVEKGVLSQDTLSTKTLYSLRGFYNGLVDSEFMRDEILKYIDFEIDDLHRNPKMSAEEHSKYFG